MTRRHDDVSPTYALIFDDHQAQLLNKLFGTYAKHVRGGLFEVA
jgi:hypothetical protein